MPAYNFSSASSAESKQCLVRGDCQFAVTNSNFSPAQLSSMKAWLLPVMAQAVVVGFHLPDSLNISDLGLRIPREALAHIFLGRIVRWSELAQWNDVSINPQLASVHENISVVVRSDAAGVSEAFTSALSSFSAEWNGTVGTNSKPDWPKADFCVDGDAGVAKNILFNPFSLGFVSQAYAKLYGVKQAVLSNRAGEYVRPTPEAVQAAMEEAVPDFEDWLGDGSQIVGDDKQIFYMSITDASSAGAYPIPMFTYIGFNADHLRFTPECQQLYNLMLMIQWGWSDPVAAEMATITDSVILPPVMYRVLHKALMRITCAWTEAGVPANNGSIFERVLLDLEVAITGSGVSSP